MSWLVPSLPSIPGWSRQTPASSSKITNGAGATTGAGAGAGKPDNLKADMEEEDEDLDKPPMFPLPDSAQRSQARPPPPPPPPPPAFAVEPPSPARPSSAEEPLSDLNIAIQPGTVPLGDMALPHSTTRKPNFGIKPGGHDEGDGGDDGGPKRFTPAPTKPKGKKGKVALGPGYSALDWARLTQSGKNLRGTMEFPLRITMDELKKHNKPDDAWSVFNGRVYNITPYLPFHPGGQDELMRVAGRDGSKLFMLTHSWVNLDFMLQECMVGMLVRG